MARKKLGITTALAVFRLAVSRGVLVGVGGLILQRPPVRAPTLVHSAPTNC